MKYVTALADIDPDDRARWGGKACSLARLHARGLPVPPAVVVSREALGDFLRENDLERLSRSRDPSELAQLRRSIEVGLLPAQLAGELRAATPPVGERLAVRSSAVEEDGRAQSFAGQFLTLVNIQPGDELERAVLRCWASLFGAEAMAYRRGARIGGMAIVVQRLVDARCAGVLFTIDPVSGSWTEMIVEAVLGQGEALVGGHVQPDRHVLHRPRRLPRGLRRLVSRLRVDVVESDVVSQPKLLAPLKAGELTWVDLPDPGRRKLETEELRRLGRLGLHAERLAREPQDLEWALDRSGEIWLLQARPITAAGEPPRGEGVLWSRRFMGERWHGLASPLGWSITSELLAWFIEYPETSARFLGGGPALRLVRGRPYVNVTVFRHLAFKLPGRPPPGFMMDFLPPAELERWTRRFTYPPDAAVYRSILVTTFREKRWQRFRWNPITNHLAWDAFLVRLERELPQLERPARDRNDAQRLLEEGVGLWRDYVKVHIISLLLANLYFQILSRFLPVDLREDLLRTPGDNPTLRTNLGLWKVGRGELAMDAFLEEFGHRTSESSWELFAPRWRDDPGHVEVLAERLSELEDPSLLAREQTHAADAALSELRRRHRGFEREALVRTTLLARRYLALREEQRFAFDRLMAALQTRTLELGSALGLGEDIRWLQWHEVQSFDDLDDVSGLIARRKKQWAEDAAAAEPPIFLVGDEGIAVQRSGRTLEGLGISPGRATGSVRIVRSLREAGRLQAGEILVARATDPGWTPLFLLASGVILEMGSMLSHGAVVAREYRLPAVVNVEGALDHLEDGQRVTVDGGRGVVWVSD